MLTPSLALWVDGQTIKLPLCYRPQVIKSSQTCDALLRRRLTIVKTMDKGCRHPSSMFMSSSRVLFFGDAYIHIHGQQSSSTNRRPLLPL